MTVRVLAGISVAFVICGAGFGQSGLSAPRFDVAEVHRSARFTVPSSGAVLRGSRYDWRNATMLSLVASSYGIDPEKVVGGPNWLEFDQFDIAAKAPAATPPETLRLMIQDLLSKRFNLALHKGTRPLPAFVLSVGRAKPTLGSE